MSSGGRRETDGSNGGSGALLSPRANGRTHEHLAAIVTLIMAIATPVAIGFHYVNHYYWGKKFPWSTFLVHPYWRFNDFLLTYRDAQWFRLGMYDNMVYSPIMHVIMLGLTLVSSDVGLVIVCAAFVVTLVLVCWRWITSAETPRLLRLQQVAVLVMLSYPVLFLIDRGNLEMVVFVFLALFFYLYYGRRSRWAWIPLALAIGGKYYWVTLLVLPLADRQIRQAVYAVLGAVGGTLAASLVIAWDSHYSVPTVIHYMLQTLGSRGDAYASLHTVQHAHTVWSAIQLSNRLLGYPFSGIRNLETGYFLIAVALFLLIAYEVVAHDMAPWRKALALIAATLVLPVESFDYTLVHLYFPLALLVCCATRSWAARAAAVLIAVCMVPVDYHYFTIAGLQFGVGLSTFIYCGALVALVPVALVTSQRERVPLRSLLVWDAWRERAAEDAPAQAVTADVTPAAPAEGGAP